jgi:hypothetical protein
MGDFDYSIRTQRVNKPYATYAALDFTVSGGLTDYSLKTHTNLFSSIAEAYDITITNSSGIVRLKLNNAGGDLIKIPANGEFKSAGLVITDILVTTAVGVTSELNVYSLGWK